MDLPSASALEREDLLAALEAAERRNQELTEAIAGRDIFIAVVAHELRNPMTPMIGQVELLLRGMATGRFSLAQTEDRLKRINNAMNHYVKRAEALLDITRITSGKLKIKPAPCDLSEVVRDVVDAFGPAASHVGSALACQAPAHIAGTWDRLAMEQIIDNLVSNAIKYGGGGAVEVSAMEDDGNVEIRIRDHGPGISPSDRERIFGRFERAVELNEGGGGFGVGLWVVGQLVNAMEGTIDVSNAEGGGAVFNVTLPRHVKVASQ